MQILSVTLHNFKTHRDKYIEFQPGINAISGENGAGKTSLLEAIAWVLFNYQGDYAKEDLICNGSGSARVTVRFTSNYDARTYEVQRCTQRGYTLFDPQLNERLPYSRIKDEVLPWLKQHIGVAATTNLPQLFARIVGVPQGTFTADFLQSAEQRKAVFDAILKVDDYKLAYKQMNSLRRYAEDQVDAIKSQIAQYEESLTEWDELQHRQEALGEEIESHQQTLKQQQQTLVTLTEQRQEMNRQQQHIVALKDHYQNVSQQIRHQQDLLNRLEQSVEQAQQAMAVCITHRDAYEGYQKTEQELQTVSQQQQHRQKLQDQYRDLQNARSKQQIKLTQLRTQLDGLVKTEQDLAALEPQIEQQFELEAQLMQRRENLEHLQQRQLERQALEQQIHQLQSQAVSLEQTCQNLIKLQAAVVELEELEEKRDRIQQKLSRVNAARQFETELRHLVEYGRSTHLAYASKRQQVVRDLEIAMAEVHGPVPELMLKLRSSLDQEEGLTNSLVEGLEGILQDLASQTNEAELTRTVEELQQAITQRYRWQGELCQMESLQEQLHKNQQQQEYLQRQLQVLGTTSEQQAATEASIEDLQQQIRNLGYPREKSEILHRTVTGKSQLEATLNQLLMGQIEQDQALSSLTKELDQFQGLDQVQAELQQRREKYQPGYGLYLQHQNLAAQHPQLLPELATNQAEMKQLQADVKAIETRLQKAQADFDEEAAVALEHQYQTVRSESDQLAGRLPEMHRRLDDLKKQIQTLNTIAERRNLAQSQLKTKEKAKRFINFARRVYKEAGPRITEQYVGAITFQADKLFRDLIGRPNVALEWSRDYDILVREGVNQRRFINLSGGEQMCAALAVRLALLKVLADIDIAFFDEPTTNMDRARRESLAEAIGRIKAFHQLFVISHDDTFEKVTENVVFLERNSV